MWPKEIKSINQILLQCTQYVSETPIHFLSLASFKKKWLNNGHEIKRKILFNHSIVFFKGGVSLVSTITKQQYSENYSGCISEIYLQDKGPLRVPEDAVGGFNVRPCLNKK